MYESILVENVNLLRDLANILNELEIIEVRPQINPFFNICPEFGIKFTQLHINDLYLGYYRKKMNTDLISADELRDGVRAAIQLLEFMG
jgi:hypothetical protein